MLQCKSGELSRNKLIITAYVLGVIMVIIAAYVVLTPYKGFITTMGLLVRIWERNVSLVDGEVYIEDREVLHMGEEEFKKEVRWRKIAMATQA